jgi:hypothetical protein
MSKLLCFTLTLLGVKAGGQLGVVFSSWEMLLILA